jgi:hypothetical protein
MPNFLVVTLVANERHRNTHHIAAVPLKSLTLPGQSAG